jgi:hypothetical protein
VEPARASLAELWHQSGALIERLAWDSIHLQLESELLQLPGLQDRQAGLTMKCIAMHIAPTLPSSAHTCNSECRSLHQLCQTQRPYQSLQTLCYYAQLASSWCSAELWKAERALAFAGRHTEGLGHSIDNRNNKTAWSELCKSTCDTSVQNARRFLTKDIAFGHD